MKRFIKVSSLLIASAMVFTILAACSSNPKNIGDLSYDEGEVRIYQVYGMDCPGCHGGLENLVNKIPGVKDSRANWEKQSLQVVLDPEDEVDDQSIYEAIRKANFTPGERLK
jgi:copper chaperone CopZ